MEEEEEAEFVTTSVARSSQCEVVDGGCSCLFLTAERAGEAERREGLGTGVGEEGAAQAEMQDGHKARKKEEEVKMQDVQCQLRKKKRRLAQHHAHSEKRAMKDRKKERRQRIKGKE